MLNPLSAELQDFRWRLDAALHPYYDDSLPGHPARHALTDTMNLAVIQAHAMADEGYPEAAEPKVMMAEAGTHDLLMGTPIKHFDRLTGTLIEESAFGTNEQRSAYLAGRILLAQFDDVFDEATVSEIIKPDIIGTTSGIKSETVTGRTLIRADVWNIGQIEPPTEDLTMFRHSIQYFYDTNEIRRRSGQPSLTWPEYMDIQHPVMRAYVDVNLADHVPAEQRLYDRFNPNASKNVEYFARPEIKDPENFYHTYATEIAKLPEFRLAIKLEDFTGQAAA